MAPWYAEFAERVVSDFPDSEPLDLLQNILFSDFNDADNAKSELVYNVITNTAAYHPSLAPEAHRLFKKFDFSKHSDYAAECIIDAALNLIVGIEDLNINDALEIYQTQKSLTELALRTLEIDRPRCALALSLIAKFPLSDPQVFRTVLADALKIYRVHRNDETIQYDTCIAISNYVNLLNQTKLKHALNLLNLFRHLAKGAHDGDMKEAWKFILYHVFLLFLADGEDLNGVSESVTSHAFDQLEGIAPEIKLYKSAILELFENDLE